MTLVVFEAVVAGQAAASAAEDRLVADALERHLREHRAHVLDADQHLPVGEGCVVDLRSAR